MEDAFVAGSQEICAHSQVGKLVDFPVEEGTLEKIEACSE